MIDQTPQATMTAQDYFALPESLDRMDLIDGELLMSPAPATEHQLLVGKLYRMIADIVPNGDVLMAPTDVYFDDGHVVQPDIFWVSPDSQCTRTPRYYQGAPDLVVEVLSPSTALRDKSIKFDLYERFGVREYWLADYNAELLEVYALSDGKYQRIGAYGFSEAFTSPTLAQSITINPASDHTPQNDETSTQSAQDENHDTN